MSKLFLVPTPIGNLKDITYRAVEVLKEADLILVEDTRISKRLLDRYHIATPVKAFHKHNEHKNVSAAIKELKNNLTIAMISDAGTPGISDPGFLLVRECLKHNIEIECLPGPTALVPAIVQSGIPSDRFYFEGFLPHKKGRTKRLKYLSSIEESIILFESPYRLNKLLQQLREYLGGERKASISRELTKIYEETRRGTLKELSDAFNDRKIKGEIVIVVQGKE